MVAWWGSIEILDVLRFKGTRDNKIISAERGASASIFSTNSALFTVVCIMVLFQAPFPPYDPTDELGWELEGFLCHLVLINCRFSYVTQLIADAKLALKHLLYSYETVVKRWPVILAGIVDQLHRENHAFHVQAQEDHTQKQALENKITEGKAIIEKISKLKYDMARDHVMECVLNPFSFPKLTLSINIDLFLRTVNYTQTFTILN